METTKSTIDIVFDIMNTLIRLELNIIPEADRIEECYRFANRRIRGY